MNRDRQTDALRFGADGRSEYTAVKEHFDASITEALAQLKDRCDQIRAYCDELLKGDSNKYQLAHRIKRVVDEIAR